MFIFLGKRDKFRQRKLKEVLKMNLIIDNFNICLLKILHKFYKQTVDIGLEIGKKRGTFQRIEEIKNERLEKKEKKIRIQNQKKANEINRIVYETGKGKFVPVYRRKLGGKNRKRKKKKTEVKFSDDFFGDAVYKSQKKFFNFGRNKKKRVIRRERKRNRDELKIIVLILKI